MESRKIVAQDNALINASYRLELSEKRLILLAIATARRSNKNMSAESKALVSAHDYAESFNVQKSTAYKALKQASENLFDRYFVYKKNGEKGFTKSRWISEITYNDTGGELKIIFAPSVIPLITDLEKRFTSYFLSDISELKSIHAIRIYEIIIAWKKVGRTPFFSLEELKKKIGLSESEYPRMTNFKQRVLDLSVNQINEKTNLKVRYEQKKQGRKIVGFRFVFYEKDFGKELAETLKLAEETVKEVENSEEKEVENSEEKGKSFRKKKRKRINKREAMRMANRGETWSELLSRLSENYYITDM